jgi:ComF family protein
MDTESERRAGLVRVHSWVASCLRAVQDLAFPTECRICETSSDGEPICAGCRERLIEAAASRCPRCALTVGPWARRDGGCSACRGRSLGFDAALALGSYEGPLRSCCLALKHRTGLWLAAGLADLLVEAHEGGLADRAVDAMVVPVPLYWTRYWRRGFNQAEALAAQIASRLDLPFRRPLRRVRSTQPLARLPRTDRARIMRDAFACRRRESLVGRTVLLVDDIMTTGATCGAAARALKRAGARRVVAIVVARAEGLP